MAIDKIFNDANVDGIADNIFGAVNNSVSEVKQMQQRKAAENVQMVIQALKKIESDLRQTNEEVANELATRIASIKDGKDGKDGNNAKDGRDGRPGRDGAKGDKGDRGLDGRNGIDGKDGVSVTDAKIDFDGSLIISLSTGQEINVGEVVSPDLADKIQVISTMSTNGAVGIKDEGTSVSTGVKTINFVGAGVTATNSGDDVTVNVSSGTGTVTSVAATVPAFLSVAGSPITTTGTLAISLSGTALPVANGGTGITSLGTGVATFLGTPSSANLAAAVTGETGTGALVFATSPALVTPALGTPSSGVVTNLTGTASININGTVGATTPSTGAFTTLSATGNITASSTSPVFSLADTTATVGKTFILSNGGANWAYGEVGLYDSTAAQKAYSYSGSLHRHYVGNSVITSVSSTGLAVTGTLSATGTATLLAGNKLALIRSSDAYGWTVFSNASNVLTFDSGINGLGTTYMSLTDSGNVGIGTTTPFSTAANRISLSVNGTTDSIVAVGAAGTRAGYIYGSTTQCNIGAQNFLAFETNNGSERARITSGGYLKASNTGSYQNSLAAYHELRQSAADFIAYVVNSNASPVGINIGHITDANSTGSPFLGCNAGAALGTLRAEIRSNGGLANYSANNANLSDRREKTNFAPASSYLDKICAIPVQTFNYIDQNLEEDGGLTLGVVAQDVQAVAPELVMESNWAGKDAEPKMRLSIYQTDLQYALMKCIQEQQALITQLTARITALETA